MSTVTQCDCCGMTARGASEFVKFKLPKAMLPEAIPSSTNTGDVPVDACHGCVEEIREALDSLITRRLAGGEPATEGETT